MMASLQLYETMSGLTRQMVTAAETGDWDRLVALEREVASLRDRLEHDDPLSAPIRLDEPTRQRKIALINGILADDRAIRSHTEPWMASLRKLLSAGTRSRNLRDTYGAHGG